MPKYWLIGYSECHQLKAKDPEDAYREALETLGYKIEIEPESLEEKLGLLREEKGQ